jgi:hypothetical protein
MLECDYYTFECDFYTLECDSHTQCEIYTRMKYDTDDCDLKTHKSDFYTQSVILIRMGVIMALTSLTTTRTSVNFNTMHVILTRTN